MKTITAKWLDDQCACERQLCLFREIFGESAEINVQNCRLAIECDLSLTWISSVLGFFYEYRYAVDRASFYYYSAIHDLDDGRGRIGSVDYYTARRGLKRKYHLDMAAAFVDLCESADEGES